MIYPERDHGESEVTQVLRAAAAGEPGQRERLLEMVYDALRNLARRHLSAERASHTLQPTALVHEAWMKLFEQATLPDHDKEHFLAVASQAMRRILVDHARTKKREKRGGGVPHVPLDGLEPHMAIPMEDSPINLVELDAALDDLKARCPRQASVVDLRFFGGLTTPEAAKVLDISVATVEREWRVARAWLLARLKK